MCVSNLELPESNPQDLEHKRFYFDEGNMIKHSGYFIITYSTAIGKER